MTRAISLVLTVAFGFFVQNALAETARQFYKGKTINIIVPYAPGGIYDIGARLLSRHLSTYIPGHPNVSVENLPGEGGIGLANNFAAGADNNGLTIGVLQRALPQYALMGDPNSRFDPLKLNWIGSLSAYSKDAYLLVFNSHFQAHDIESLAAARVTPKLGSGRSGSTDLTLALVAQQVLNIKLDIVRGYGGSAEIFLAMQRGEVDGVFSDLSSIKAGMRDLWSSKQIRPYVQFARKTRLDSLPDVPTARELVHNADDLALLKFAESPFFMAVPIAAPAGMPHERLAALQKAFKAVATDTGFLKDAEKSGYPVDPIDGDAVRDAVIEASTTPKSVVDRFRSLVLESGRQRAK